MTQHEGLQFAQGETWHIQIACVDQTGAPQDITGGSVQFRMANTSALVLDLTLDASGSGFTSGRATIVVGTSDTTPLTPSLYHFEARSVLPDGTVYDQLVGTINVEPSLFVRFPYTPPATDTGGALNFADSAESGLIGH